MTPRAERLARRVEHGCDERREDQERGSEEPAPVGGRSEDEPRCAPSGEDARGREVEEQPDEERSDGKSATVELEPGDDEHRCGTEPDGEFTAAGPPLRGGTRLLQQDQGERKEREGEEARTRCSAHGNCGEVGRREQDRDDR
jgi:hypothetical protein